MTRKPAQPRYRQMMKNRPEMAEMACVYWKIGIDHLIENGLLTDARVRIVDRYARACAEFEIVHQQALVDGPVKVGPNGGDLYNFLWTAAEKLNDRIAKLEAALLITPQSVGGKLKDKPADGPKAASDEFLAAARPN